jgi:hypothetical protein
MTAIAETRSEVNLLDWRSTGAKETVSVNLASGVDVTGHGIGIAARQRSAVGAGFKLVRPKTTESSQAAKLRVKTLRRIRGFLVETIGAESKVAFEDKGSVIFYYLPADNLTKAGITDQNQPFEMDEIEFRLGPNDHIAGYRFKPLAKVTDAFPEAVPLDQEYKDKLQVILHHFKGA